MEVVRFTLCPDLEAISQLPKGHLHEMKEHPTAADIVVVTFEDYDGETGVAYYTKERAFENLSNGTWIKVKEGGPVSL